MATITQTISDTRRSPRGLRRGLGARAAACPPDAETVWTVALDGWPHGDVAVSSTARAVTFTLVTADPLHAVSAVRLHRDYLREILRERAERIDPTALTRVEGTWRADAMVVNATEAAAGRLYLGVGAAMWTVTGPLDQLMSDM